MADHNNPQSRTEEILIATIDGEEYDKLPQSRLEELLLELKEVIEEGGGGGGGIRPIGVTTTPLYDGATTNPIQINGESYTAETGDMVTYQSTEFLFNVNEVWQELGDVSEILSIIDNIFADIAPAFDAAGTYAVGDYVIYNDQLYRCTTAHTGAWDENDFIATTISDEIADVSDAVDEIKDGTYIDSFADVETALADKVSKVDGKGLSTNDYDDTEKAAVAAATSAISAMKDGSDIDSFGDVEVALLDKADISYLGTAAAKDSTNSVTAGSTDLVESGAVKDAIDAAVSSAYHHAGTKTVAQLTHDLLVAANEGNVYNITDSGTTTSDFIEGIGKTIDEGSNVGICKVGNVYMFDLLSGFVDTTNFVQKSQTAGLLNNDGTVNTTIEDDIDSLKSGLTNYENQNNLNLEVPNRKNILNLSFEKIKALCTEGTWNGTTYVYKGVTYVFTVVDGYITKISISGKLTSNRSRVWIAYNEDISNYSGCILNGCPDLGGTSYMSINIQKSTTPYTTYATDAGSGANIGNITSNGQMFISIGASFDSQTPVDVYPMIRPASITDPTFAPYIPSVESRMETIETPQSYTVTYDTANVGGNAAQCVKIGRLVVCHLEYTPLSGQIANGNKIATGFPAPYMLPNQIIGFNDGRNSIKLSASGNLAYYYPQDTSDTERHDINICYVSAT